ncbi:MAG: hypothetical protein HOQ22_14955 [Nocardioidaceae bacterium]|nr:hypothetical protein [Nocardioidaceae bacterium]NUS52326.1 hypothetical protein [Nocardioidaceae bacterium]
MTDERDRADRARPSEEERRRRRAKVFGDVLPDETRDERGDAWGERRDRGDDWLRGQVPPHHGD